VKKLSIIAVLQVA